MTSPARSPSLPATASLTDAQAWSSVVLKDELTLEHAAVDITTDRVLYHLRLELQHPIPEACLAHAEFLALTWPVGGLWKIVHLGDGNRRVHCMSWRKTEMSHEDVEELAKKVEAAGGSNIPDITTGTDDPSNDQAKSDELPPTLFAWKMQLGVWGDNKHWFLRDVMPPSSTKDTTDSQRPGPLTAQLVAGFAPLEVQIEVNSLTAVETVAQTFSADVTWEMTLPAITAIREDSVLRELLDILEFDESQFEFSNINSMQEERDLASSLSPAGKVHFTNATSLEHSLKSTTENLSHLQLSRRVVAVFSEEMTLHSFPIDQQKITFSFSTGSGVRKSLRITPAPVEAGSFAINNYKLGNVFNVVHHDKVFVGQVDAEGERKAIRFEMMLERRAGYHLTNVAVPAGVITYLCFISYAPLEDGSLMDTGDRVQIVLTLLLTAVTFKNQVAGLIPQVSYFTALDSYVFFCFVITCLVTIENALFPLFVGLFPSRSRWQENGLLGISCGFFTLVNLVWTVYSLVYLKIRHHAANVLITVHEYIRVLSTSIPAEHREAVLNEFLKQSDFYSWALPKVACTESGYLFVQLPADDATPRTKTEKMLELHSSSRQHAEKELAVFQDIFHKLNPAGQLLAVGTGHPRTLRAAKPNEIFLARTAFTSRRHSLAITSNPVGTSESPEGGRHRPFHRMA